MGKSSKFRGVTLFKPSLKWRAQISTGGKTTSLGDHENEVEAAHAFDRAALNRGGPGAALNFPVEDYEDELEELRTLPFATLVAQLRSKARRQHGMSSAFRGVSLLKQTGKFHAQINVGGKQWHLGFFASEEAAARAYDRAALHKAHTQPAASGPGSQSPPALNFPVEDYAEELSTLVALSQAELLSHLAPGGPGSLRRRGSAESLGGASDGPGPSGLSAGTARIAPRLPEQASRGRAVRGKGRRTRLAPARATLG